MTKELRALPILLAAVAVLAMPQLAWAQVSAAARPKPVAAPEIDPVSVAEGLAVAGAGAILIRENPPSSVAS